MAGILSLHFGLGGRRAWAYSQYRIIILITVDRIFTILIVSKSSKKKNSSIFSDCLYSRTTINYKKLAKMKKNIQYASTDLSFMMDETTSHLTYSGKNTYDLLLVLFISCAKIDTPKTGSGTFPISDLIGKKPIMIKCWHGFQVTAKGKTFWYITDVHIFTKELILLLLPCSTEYVAQDKVPSNYCNDVTRLAIGRYYANSWLR